MKEDILEQASSRKVVNKLKPYMDPTTGYIIHPTAKWYEVVLKYEDRWHKDIRKGGK